MKHIPLAVATLGVSLLVGASDAAGQLPIQSARPITIGVGGGVSVPTSKAGDDFDTGFHALGFLGLNIPGLAFGLRATFTFDRFELQDPLGGSGGDAEQAYEQVLSGLGNVVLPMRFGRITPYLLAGVGAFKINRDVTGRDGEERESKVEFGINGGAGVMFPISKLNAFIEARINNVYTSEDGAIDSNDIRFIPVTFGISL